MRRPGLSPKSSRMKRNNLLFVSARFPFPADCGGKIRTRDILRGMKGGRFEIALASPQPPDGSRRFAEELRRVCDRFVGWPETARGLLWTVARCMSLLSQFPLAVATDRSDAGRGVLATELARGADLVVADFPHSTVLLPARLSSPSVLFTHNVEAEIFRRHAAVASSSFHRAVWESQGRKMQRFEDDAARRFGAVVTVSERDYVIPLRVGGGTRIKAYEAMAAGCPVVSTTIGVEGLPVVPDRDCLIGDTAEAFGVAVLRLLDDAGARRTLARSARHLVEHRFSAKAAAAVFEGACLRAAAMAERAAA